jgi:hypothetical protein
MQKTGNLRDCFIEKIEIFKYKKKEEGVGDADD